MTAGPPALEVDRRSISLRTAGATSVPKSSMARITFSCGIVPTLICAIKRLWPKSSCSKRIFCTTSSGLPTTSAPRGERPISNCLRPIGVQPRSPRCSLAVEPGEGREVLGLTADDRDRQREAEHRGTNDRLRRSPDGDPDGQRSLERARVDSGVLERRAVLARPRDTLGIAHLKQQFELLGKQLVVIAQVVTEQRERLDERASACHDLRAAVRDEIERGEVLEDAHRVVGAQNRDRARQANGSRAGSGGRQHHSRRRDGVVGAMVLADAEDVEAELICQLDLLEEVVQPPCRVDLGADVGEGVEAKFHRRFLSGPVRCERNSGIAPDAWRRRRPQRSHASAPTRSSDDQAPSKRYHEPSADEARRGDTTRCCPVSSSAACDYQTFLTIYGMPTIDFSVESVTFSSPATCGPPSRASLPLMVSLELTVSSPPPRTACPTRAKERDDKASSTLEQPHDAADP